MTDPEYKKTKAIQIIETAILKADSQDKDGIHKRLFGSAMGSLRELEYAIERSVCVYQWFLEGVDVPGWEICCYADGTQVISMNYGETMILKKQKKE